MKTQDAKRELGQHRVERRFQKLFADAGDRRYDLPLRDLIDGVDVVHALVARLIALMDGIDTQEPRLSLGIGPAPLANGYLRWSWLRVMQLLLAGLGALAQVVQMGDGNGSQTLVFALAVTLIFPSQNVPGRRPAERFMRFVDSGQQSHIPGRVP